MDAHHYPDGEQISRRTVHLKKGADGVWGSHNNGSPSRPSSQGTPLKEPVYVGQPHRSRPRNASTPVQHEEPRSVLPAGCIPSIGRTGATLAGIAMGLIGAGTVVVEGAKLVSGQPASGEAAVSGLGIMGAGFLIYNTSRSR